MLGPALPNRAGLTVPLQHPVLLHPPPQHHPGRAAGPPGPARALPRSQGHASPFPDPPRSLQPPTYLWALSRGVSQQQDASPPLTVSVSRHRRVPPRHAQTDTLHTHAHTHPRYPTPADTRGFGADQFSTGKIDLVHPPAPPRGAGTRCCPVPPSSTPVPKRLHSSLGTLLSAAPAVHLWVYFLFQAHFSMKIRLIGRGKVHEKLLSSFPPQKSLAHGQK